MRLPRGVHKLVARKALNDSGGATTRQLVRAFVVDTTSMRIHMAPNNVNERLFGDCTICSLGPGCQREVPPTTKKVDTRTHTGMGWAGVGGMGQSCRCANQPLRTNSRCRASRKNLGKSGEMLVLGSVGWLVGHCHCKF